MPIRKPRRDPTHTAGWLEALFFPTIIDRIFNYAPHESLLVLRATCRSWKDLSEGHMVHSIVVSRRPDSRVTSCSVSTASGHSIPRRKWLDTKLVREIRHLDVLHWYIPAWIKKTDAINSVRYRPTGASAVLAFYPTVPVTAWWNRSLDTSNDVDLEGMGRPKHLTIAIGSDCQTLPDLLELPESLTVVLCEDPDITCNLTIEILCWFISEILLEAASKARSLAITLVDFEAYFPPPSDLILLRLRIYRGDQEFRALWEGEYRELSKVLIHEQLIEVRPQLHESGTTAERAIELLETVRSITMEEWREEVGEDEVRWATELAR